MFSYAPHFPALRIVFNSQPSNGQHLLGTLTISRNSISLFSSLGNLVSFRVHTSGPRLLGTIDPSFRTCSREDGATVKTSALFSVCEAQPPPTL